MLNASQTFFVDKGAVQNAAEVNITAIDLFFKNKPNETNNGSGITAPGVTIQLVPTANGIPVLEHMNIAPTVRVEYNAIKASADAREKTTFRFSPAAPVGTNREFAIVINYDGDEDFELWTSKQDDYLIGTTQRSPGPSGKYIGKYFTKITGAPSIAVSQAGAGLMLSDSGSAGNINLPTQAYTAQNWRSHSDIDLKFAVHVARYAVNGDPIDNPEEAWSPGLGGVTVEDGIWSLRVPSAPMEYVIFDSRASLVGNTLIGERVFQNTVPWAFPNTTVATVSVSNTSQLMIGPDNINFNDMFGRSSEIEYVVVTSKDHAGAGADVVCIRRVMGVQANNILRLDMAANFTNAAATFFKSPIGYLSTLATIQHFGATRSVMILSDTNANAECRFVNNTIQTVSITTPGTGYSNSDVLTINGYEDVAGYVKGGYPAKANVRTNSSGNLVSIHLSNVGAGFVNTAQTSFAIANSTGGSVSGGATFSVTTGAVMKAELLGTTGFGGRFANCEVINLGFGQLVPKMVIMNPTGTVYNAYQRFGYYEASADTHSGKAFYAYPDPSTTETLVTDGVKKKIVTENPPVMTSRSNEFNILYPNGAICNATSNSLNHVAIDRGASNASVLIFRTTSNNDFQTVAASAFDTKITYSEFIYNDDYTGENTNYGNAWAKGVTTKVNLKGDGAYAEDLVVYVTAHRPVNTDIQVFAKIHNSTDSETFDDKDWTRLEYKGTALYSSPNNEDDMHEFTFGFQAAPNTGTTYAGSVTTVLNQANVNGSGTTLNTLAAGDLVKIYQPLFPNNYMIAPVASVTNTTQIILTDPVANAGMVGTGLKIEKIDYKKQAYSNKLNDNVVRYYTTGGAAVDGFDTMQFKIVLLSSNTLVYPIVDDVRAVAVSA